MSFLYAIICRLPKRYRSLMYSDNPESHLMKYIKIYKALIKEKMICITFSCGSALHYKPMKNLIVTCLVFLVLAGNVWSQRTSQGTQKTDPKEIFLEAESDFLFEEYNEALPLYMKLIKIFPDNSNLKYHIGVCLLNDPFQKELSIQYLEEASQNTTKDYKENTFKETKAPIDAFFYLGHAYRINNQLEKAIKAYTKFKEILDPKIYDIDLVNEQITSCKNAEKLIKRPVDLTFVNLGDPINTRFSETNPVVTHDETSMLFIRKLQFYDAVFYTKKVNGQWSDPVNIMFDLGVDNDMYPTSLSSDGKEAFFYSNDNFLGTIFSSKLENGKWTKVKPLNDNINTKYWESHACISADGTTLYFTSNRKDGFGGLDIYKSTRAKGGDWGPAVNLGSRINTRYNEETPFITEDGKTLYFSTYGHYNMGGYDVNYSTLLDDGTWSVPVNAGYPINSTDDDLFFVPVKNGEFAYISKYIENNMAGRNDIYRFEIFSDMHPRKYLIHGIVSLEGKAISQNNPVTVMLINRIKRDTVQLIKSLGENGEYNLDIPAGDYDMIITAAGYKPRIERLLVPKNYKQGDLQLSSKLSVIEKETKTEEVKEIKPVYSPSKLEIRKKNFDLSEPGQVKIILNIENGETLDVNAYLDNRLIKTDKLNAAKGRITYIYLPEPGLNTLVFRLTGTDNQVHSDTVLVNLQGNAQEEEQTTTGLQGLSSVPDNLPGLLNEMKNNSQGNLKKALNELNLSGSSINSSADLIHYLIENAGKYGYSKEELLSLLGGLSAHMSINDLLARMTMSSSGNLKKTLQNIDPARDSIRNGMSLINYLIDHAKSGNYSRSDVLHVLALAAAIDTPDGNAFLNKLIAFSDGKTRSYLESLNIPSGIKTIPAITDYIYAHAGDKNVKEEDITQTLVNAASSYTLKEWIQKLLPYTDGNLRNFLLSLNPSAEKLYTPDQLIRFLLNNASAKGYTEEDLIRMLTFAALAKQDNVEGLREILASHSSGELNKTITGLVPQKEQIGTSEAYVDSLLVKTKSHGYTTGDLLKALAEAAYDGDPDDHLIRIAGMMPVDSASSLMKLIPSKKGILTMPALYEYLGTHLSRYDLSTDGLNNITARYIASRHVEEYLHKMIPLTEGNLHAMLQTTDVYKLKITSIPALVDYMFSQATSASYKEKEVLDVLQKMDNRLMLETTLLNMEGKANDTLATILHRINIDKLRIYNRNACFEYLINQGASANIPASGWYSLIIQSVAPDIPNEVIWKEMLKHCQGKIRSLLKNNPPKASEDRYEYTSRLLKRSHPSATSGELYKVFLKAIYSIEKDNLKQDMVGLSNGNLNEFLKNLNAKKDTTGSRYAFIGLVNSSAGIQPYTLHDAGILIGLVHEKMLQNDFIRRMQEGNSSSLSVTSSENFSDMVSGFLNQSNTNLTGKDHMHILLQALDREELIAFHKQLSDNSDGKLKAAIDGINLQKENCRTALDIVNYLVAQAPSRGYTETDIAHLLNCIINNRMNDLLNQMHFRSSFISHGISGILWISGTGILVILLLILFILRQKKKQKKQE